MFDCGSGSQSQLAPREMFFFCVKPFCDHIAFDTSKKKKQIGKHNFGFDSNLLGGCFNEKNFFEWNFVVAVRQFCWGQEHLSLTEHLKH